MKRKPDKTTIVLANTAEAFKIQLMQSAGTEDGQAKIRIESDLSQRAFFWEGDNKIVVTPHRIPRCLFEANIQALGYRAVKNLSPKEEAVDLSLAVIKDAKLLSQLIDFAKSHARIKLTTYATTPSFTLLIDRFKQAGVSIEAPENPAKLDVVAYLDSKVGFREVVCRLSRSFPQVKIPIGFICEGHAEAVKKVKYFLNEGKSCVLKVNGGESGWGLMILKTEQFSDGTEVARYIEKQFVTDPIWVGDRLVVGEYIHLNSEISGGSPSTEVYISSSGPKITYTCEQILTVMASF